MLHVSTPSLRVVNNPRVSGAVYLREQVLRGAAAVSGGAAGRQEAPARAAATGPRGQSLPTAEHVLNTAQHVLDCTQHVLDCTQHVLDCTQHVRDCTQL